MLIAQNAFCTLHSTKCYLSCILCYEQDSYRVHGFRASKKEQHDKTIISIASKPAASLLVACWICLQLCISISAALAFVRPVIFTSTHAYQDDEKEEEGLGHVRVNRLQRIIVELAVSERVRTYYM